jgi:hypothetical protein
LIELLANRGDLTASSQNPAEPGGAWADRLVDLATGWLLDTIAERLALAVIGALI